MPIGRAHRPLFDLVGDEPAARAAARTAKPTVRVELQPRPAASDLSNAAPPPPASPERPVPRPAASPRVASGGLAALLGDASVRVPLNAIYFGVAAIIVVLVITWFVAFNSGVRTADKQLPLFTSEHSAPVSDPLNTAPGKQPEMEPPQPKQNVVEKAAPKVKPPETTVLTAPGTTPGDPRVSGKNYYELGMVPKAEAEAAIAFFAKNGMEVFGFPMDSAAKNEPAKVDKGGRGVKNPSPTGVYMLIVSRGITSDEYKDRHTARTNIEATIARLGPIWQKDHRGTTNFAKTQWTRY